MNQILGGRYQVIRGLGATNQSGTYLVEDTGLSGHPKCVVRRLPLPAKSPRALKFVLVLLKKKAEALKYAGEHEQVPKILDYFEEKRNFYLVEEFIVGQSLSKDLKAGKIWPESAVIEFLRDALNILVTIHSWGVIHRNIKPSNLIRRSTDRRLVLTGFGIFEEISNQIIRSRITDSPYHHLNGAAVYAPEEQFQGKVHFNTDLYALGMIGIQALTGLSTSELIDLRQANGKSTGSIFSWHQYANVQSPLVSILNKLVHPDSQQRYQNATEVLDDLQFLTENAGAPDSNPEANQDATNTTMKRHRGHWLTGVGIAALVAIALFSAIYARLPQKLIAQYFSHRANEYEQADNYQQAIAQYDQAIRNYGTAETYLNRGIAYYEMGNWQVAQRDLSRAIDLQPDLADAHYYRGNIRFNLGDRQGALEDYTQAIQNDPSNVPAYINRGSVRAESGDERGAIEDYDQAIQHDPSRAAAYLNRCLSRSNLGDHQGAITDCNQAISLQPNSVLAYQNRGLARRRLGDTLGAIEDFNIAIRLDPDDSDPYYNRGLARMEIGDRTGAIADYSEAIRLNPTHALAYYDRALARIEAGDRDGAIADLQQSAKLCLDAVKIGCYEDAQYQLNQLQQS
ncbi:MAG: tetratricopeptide repeat protein [Elainellaceae cyanobacterium]